MTRVVLRPTVASDLPQLVAMPLPHRIRAITAVLPGEDGEAETILGFGGIGYRPDGTAIAFAVMTDAFRKYPVAVHRAGLMGMKLIRDSGLRIVVAEAEEGNPAAEPWLLRFGFRPRVISGRRAFVWEREA